LLAFLLPLAMRLFAGRGGALAAAVLALVGGFVLRYAIVLTPPELLATAPHLSPRSSLSEAQTPIGTAGSVGLHRFRPEEGRDRGGGPGADPGNRAGEVQPRSKLGDGE